MGEAHRHVFLWVDTVREGEKLGGWAGAQPHRHLSQWVHTLCRERMGGSIKPYTCLTLWSCGLGLTTSERQ